RAGLNRLARIRYQVADLPGHDVGMALPGVIVLDRTADRYGWSLAASGPEANRVDLLTVVLHEMGHELGLDHDHGDRLMADRLAPGTRHLPDVQEVRSAPLATSRNRAAWGHHAFEVLRRVLHPSRSTRPRAR